MKFNFGCIVIVEDNLVGVVVKSWENMSKRTFNYDVYVRSWNVIRNFEEDKMKHMRYDKELVEDIDI